MQFQRKHGGMNTACMCTSMQIRIGMHTMGRYTACVLSCVAVCIVFIEHEFLPSLLMTSNEF